MELHVPFTNCFVCRWFCVVHDPKPPLHSHNWLSFGKFQDTERFLIHCERHFSSRLPPSGGTWKYAKAPSAKKPWRDSLPIDMLLSAMSVLVVAQSSSEIPERLMNNPVWKSRDCTLKLVFPHCTFTGSFHTSHCVEQPVVSQPQTREWLLRTCVALTSYAGPDLLRRIFPHQMHSFNAFWHCSGSCKGSRTTLCYCSGPATRKCSSRWGGQPVLREIGCRVATYLLKGWIRHSGLAVFGNCVSGHWVARVMASFFRSVKRKEFTDLKKSENKECEYITNCME